jgi:hypothetical protein
LSAIREITRWGRDRRTGGAAVVTGPTVLVGVRRARGADAEEGTPWSQGDENLR